MAANSSSGRLARYRAKRAASATPEPFGSAPQGPAGGRFVVQKHAARQLHYDLRLEMGGVLVSWAVPRGPSLDPADKRLAVHVEDHPLDYGDFEGVIPAGQYGAGSVIVWDRGTYRAIDEPGVGFEHGKLLFELAGHKLRGRFTLVKTRRKGGPGNEWLLIKKPDGFAGPRELPQTSVLSGLEVEVLASARQRGVRLARRLARLGARRQPVDPAQVELMLCQPWPAAFSDPAWRFELKYDGFRMIAAAIDGEAHCRYRGGRDATRLYPELALALRSLPDARVVLDGEVVVFDARGKSDFGRLQARALLGDEREIARAAVTHPEVFVAFDVLGYGELDLRGLPLDRRRELLAELVPETGILRRAMSIERRGEDLYRQVAALGLEGMVAKRRDSRYVGARSPAWRKIRLARVDDFAVIGYTAPRGSRAGLGALHLAVREADAWRYAGRVGSGLDDRMLGRLRDTLAAAPRAEYGFARAITTPSVWLAPTLVVSVRFKEWPRGKLLRQPVFLALREDKRPDECVAPPAHHDRPPDVAAPVAAPARRLELANLDKVFWPADGLTKGDLLAYYRAISPWLLPYLADRPLVLTRYPDGIAGKSFYQKDAPTWVPPWIRTRAVWSESSHKDVHYFVADELDALLYVVNLGAIPLHIWPSRVADLARPDFSIIDLDPKGAPFADVVALARAIRALCDEIELPTYVKTSGSTGLHVLIPLGRQCTYEQSRQLAGLLSQIIECEHGALATMARSIRARRGKVYLDWLQNRHGQLLVAPFSVRPLPGAPVSMPLAWREVGPRLTPGQHTIATALRRMDRLGDDPMAAVLRDRPALVAVLERLALRLARAAAPKSVRRRRMR